MDLKNENTNLVKFQLPGFLSCHVSGHANCRCAENKIRAKPVILIAGATGNLGGKIIRELLKLGQLDPLDNNRYA
jgi:hypothetical protein